MEGQKGELGSGAPPDTGLSRVRRPEILDDGGNDLVPEFPQEQAEVSCHV